MDKASTFHMEAAGDLTPELNGAPRSGAHPHRTKEKGRGTGYEARQEKAQVLPMDEEPARREHE